MPGAQDLGGTLRIGDRLVGCCAASTVAAMVLGGGIANASDPLIGKTFSAATAKMAEWKATPVVSSVVGGVLDRDDCIVTSWHKSVGLDSSGRKKDESSIFVNLNCNAALASAGKPGNSLATPEGRLELKNETDAEYINTHPEYCQKNATKCDWFCDKYAGKCTNWPL